MPLLSSLLQSGMAVQEYILDEELSNLRAQPRRVPVWEWRVLTNLAEMCDIYRGGNSRNGALYDVFSEYVLPDNHINRSISKYELKRNVIRNILDHNFDLLRKAGLTTESGSILSSLPSSNISVSEISSDNNGSNDDNNGSNDDN